MRQVRLSTSLNKAVLKILETSKQLKLTRDILKRNPKFRITNLAKIKKRNHTKWHKFYFIYQEGRVYVYIYIYKMN